MRPIRDFICKHVPKRAPLTERALVCNGFRDCWPGCACLFDPQRHIHNTQPRRTTTAHNQTHNHKRVTTNTTTKAQPQTQLRRHNHKQPQRHIHSTQPQRHIHSTPLQGTTTNTKPQKHTLTTTNTHNHRHVRQYGKKQFEYIPDRLSQFMSKMFLLCVLRTSASYAFSGPDTWQAARRCLARMSVTSGKQQSVPESMPTCCFNSCVNTCRKICQIEMSWWGSLKVK